MLYTVAWAASFHRTRSPLPWGEWNPSEPAARRSKDHRSGSSAYTWTLSSIPATSGGNQTLTTRRHVLVGIGSKPSLHLGVGCIGKLVLVVKRTSKNFPSKTLSLNLTRSKPFLETRWQLSNTVLILPEPGTANLQSSRCPTASSASNSITNLLIILSSYNTGMDPKDCTDLAAERHGILQSSEKDWNELHRPDVLLFVSLITWGTVEA